MPQHAVLLNAGFSTADAASPRFAWHEAGLTLEFQDWQGRAVCIAFENPAAVVWQQLGSSGPEDRDDSVYEIAGSEWIAAYLRTGSWTPHDGLRHFKLCFNARGVFEVLATTMRLSAG